MLLVNFFKPDFLSLNIFHISGPCERNPQVTALPQPNPTPSTSNIEFCVSLIFSLNSLLNKQPWILYAMMRNLRLISDASTSIRVSTRPGTGKYTLTWTGGTTIYDAYGVTYLTWAF